MNILNTLRKIEDWDMVQQKTEYSLLFVLPMAWYLSLTFYYHLQSNLYMSFLDVVDFLVHELGHRVFSIFGNQFLQILWGSLFQLIIPLACLIWFYIQRDRFAVVFSYAWIGINFFYIATYAWDAQKMALPLMVTGSWDPIHDWNYILIHLWILRYTDAVAYGFRVLASIFFVIFFLNMFFILLNKLRNLGDMFRF